MNKQVKTVPGGKAAAPKHSPMHDFFSVLSCVKFSWGLIIAALILSLVGSVVSSKVPEATAGLFNGDFGAHRLLSVIATMLFSFLLSVSSVIVRSYAEAFSTRNGRNYVWKLMMNAKASYYDETDPSSLLTIATIDMQTMASGLVQLIIFVPSVFVLVASCLIAITGYSKDLLWAIVMIIPIHLVYFIFVGNWQYRLGKKMQIEIGRLTGYLSERIKNLPLIKTFLNENKEKKNGNKAIDKLYRVMRELRIITGVNNGYQIFTTGASTIIAVLWGSHLLKLGKVDMVQWLAFSLFVPMINGGLMELSIIWTFIRDFQGRAYRLARLREAPSEAASTSSKKEKKASKVRGEAIPHERLDGDIALEHVDFSYPGGRQILKDVSFTIPEGKITALVGPSGSGKTTVIKLLERLYDVSAGKISVGAESIDKEDVKAWRGRLSYVVQNAGTFSGTIRKCMTYGLGREVSDEELRAVSDKCGITEFVSRLPQGFDTELGNWGGTLSGGQRQRLVIARELLKDSDIILLDEPTSALDPQMAGEIADLIFKSFTGKTVILVTHELGFISHADQIVVLSQGEVIGKGKHDALMSDCPVYRKLVEEQSYQEVFS